MPLDPRIAVYTGTFDPVHLGHVDIIRRGSRLFQQLIVGVGMNPEKAPFLTVTERIELLETVCKPFKNVGVKAFDGLAVKFVRAEGAGLMLRGLRTLSDMEYEFNMSLTNSHLAPDIETVFMMAQVEHSHFSSSLIRQIGALGGDLHRFLPLEIRSDVEARVRERSNGLAGQADERN